MKVKRQIPNAITSANLLCGCIAVTQIATGELVYASLFILLGAFFDFFDGMSARLLNVGSPIGAELDSLADVITFGLAPAYLLFSILDQSNIHPLISYIAFLIAIFSALRLAKFNVDDRQTESFIGLPTPANALFWISLPLIEWQTTTISSIVKIDKMQTFLSNPYLLIGFCILLSLSLIAEIPLLSLKLKSLSWKENQNRFLLLLFSILLIAVFYFAAIPFILLLYFIFSFIENRKISDEI